MNFNFPVKLHLSIKQLKIDSIRNPVIIPVLYQ